MKNTASIYTEKKVSHFDYINMFFLLSLSGITFFSGNQFYALLIFGLNLIKFAIDNKRIDKDFLYALYIIIVVSAAQILWFKDGELITYSGLFIRVTTAYLVVKNINDFAKIFVHAMVFLSIAAIFFYFFFLVFPSIEEMMFTNKSIWDNHDLYDIDKNIILYNIHREPLFGDQDALGLFGLPRNSGPFWEPGAFAGYLILAIVFENFIPYSKNRFRVLILLFALFTTFSTTGYIAILIFFLLNSIFINNKGKLIIFVLPILLIGGLFVILKTDFIGNKISSQMEDLSQAQKYNAADDNQSRLGSAFLDFADLQRSPLFGTGPSAQTRYGPKEKLFMRTNGVTDLLVRFGILGFISFFILLSRSTKRFFRNNEIEKYRQASFVFIILLVVVASSEIYFNMPFFWTLLFLPCNKISNHVQI